MSAAAKATIRSAPSGAAAEWAPVSFAGIVVSCQNERSQIQNRASAMNVLQAKLLELRRHQDQAAMDALKDSGNSWGNQMRSYVLHPYQMVKDLRTGHETGNTSAVLDGDLDAFMQAELERLATGGEWRGDDTGDAA